MKSIGHLTASLLMMGVVTMTSCGTAASGAFNGATFGGIIGSCIGGISGGPRGSDIGTLVGMATGAAAGVAIGSAVERRAQGDGYAYSGGGAAEYGAAERSEQPVYDDVITLQPQRQGAAEQNTSIVVDNVRFINDAGTMHIARGELVKISFEIRNTTAGDITNIVPVVDETTRNKRLMHSPTTMVESLGPHKGIRYTAYISAQDNLRTGTAHFRIYVMTGNAVVSNVIEFDIPLN